MTTHNHTPEDDPRLEALFGEALGDEPTAEETAEALRRFRRDRERSDRRWLYYAAAILFLPVMVIAVPVLISYTGIFSPHEPQSPAATEQPAAPARPQTDDTEGTAGMRFDYDNVPFDRALEDIATFYGLAIEPSDSPVPTVPIHFSYPRAASPDEIIDALNDLGIARLKVEGNSIHILPDSGK